MYSTSNMFIEHDFVTQTLYCTVYVREDRILTVECTHIAIGIHFRYMRFSRAFADFAQVAL